MKIVKELNLNETYLIDGGFFYIERQDINDSVSRKYSRYFLRTVASPEKMGKLKEYIETTSYPPEQMTNPKSIPLGKDTSQLPSNSQENKA